MECPECGMGYVPGYPDKVKQHKKYHDGIANGPYAPRIKSDEVLWEDDTYRITVVNPRSPKAQRKRVENVGRVARRDTRYDRLPYYHNEPLEELDLHPFLLYFGRRIVGLLLVERRDRVKEFTWEEYDNLSRQVLPKSKPIWTVGFAWIHQKHRRQHWASKLVQVAVSYFEIEVNTIGWYMPFTIDGERLARSLCPESFFAAK